MISEAPYALRGGREETAESTAQTEQATVANVSTHGIKHYSLHLMARSPQSQSQGHASSRPRPQNFVLDVEASPRGPYPCILLLKSLLNSTLFNLVKH